MYQQQRNKKYGGRQPPWLHHLFMVPLLNAMGLVKRVNKNHSSKKKKKKITVLVEQQSNKGYKIGRELTNIREKKWSPI